MAYGATSEQMLVEAKLATEKMKSLSEKAALSTKSTVCARSTKIGYGLG